MNDSVCSLARRFVPKVVDILNGKGPKPAAVTVGGQIFYFIAPNDQLTRHEEKHIDQGAARCPFYLRWLPRKARAWIGFPKFSRDYLIELEQHGYVLNKFEVEARIAENG